MIFSAQIKLKSITFVLPMLLLCLPISASYPEGPPKFYFDWDLSTIKTEIGYSTIRIHGKYTCDWPALSNFESVKIRTTFSYQPFGTEEWILVDDHPCTFDNLDDVSEIIKYKIVAVGLPAPGDDWKFTMEVTGIGSDLGQDVSYKDEKIFDM